MKTLIAPWAAADKPDAVTVRSGDGVVAVSLKRTAGGLFVLRTLQRHREARVVQAARFGSAQDFRRWCEADGTCFEYPLMMSRLIRHADDLFVNDDAPANAG